MREGRRRHRQDLDLRQKIVEGIPAEGRHAKVCRGLFGAVGVEVVDADEVDVRRLLILIGVIAAEHTGPGNAGFQDLHENGLAKR